MSGLIIDECGDGAAALNQASPARSSATFTLRGLPTKNSPTAAIYRGLALPVGTCVCEQTILTLTGSSLTNAQKD
jgi:hypothetical protein